MNTTHEISDRAAHERLIAEYEQHSEAFRTQKDRLFGENLDAEYKVTTDVGEWQVSSNEMMVFFELNLAGPFPQLPTRHYHMWSRVGVGFNLHNTFGSTADSQITHAPNKRGTRSTDTDDISNMNTYDPIMLASGLVIGNVFEYQRNSQHTVDVLRSLSDVLATIETE